MPGNKTTPRQDSVPAFIDALSDETQRADAKALIKLIQGATGEEPTMWGSSIVGFGSYHYTYESGRAGDAPRIGFSPRKAAHVLYNALTFDGAAALLAKLGKHTVGKGCLYIKKLTDVDQHVLYELVTQAFAASRARHTG